VRVLALAMLVALAGVADAAGPEEIEAVARDLVYCSTIADTFSEKSPKLREHRDFLLGSAAALTSDQFVASERAPALTRVQAKLADAKQATEGGGSSRPQLEAFIEDLKGCSRQVLTYQNEIAAGLRKLKERRP
jgi:hypothetical protein